MATATASSLLRVRLTIPTLQQLKQLKQKTHLDDIIPKTPQVILLPFQL
jgi:hypothetical protein